MPASVPPGAVMVMCVECGREGVATLDAGGGTTYPSGWALADGEEERLTCPICVLRESMSLAKDATG
jgi:hypothetical protein